MLRYHGIKHVAQTTAITRPEAVRHRETYSAPNRKSMFVKWSWEDHIIQPTLPEIWIISPSAWGWVSYALQDVPPKHEIFGYVILFCFLKIQA